jgi:hypothetical protein
VKRQSVAKKCLAFSGLFEAELLLELMLRFWEHPLAADRDFRNDLLENAADALRSSISGQQLIEEIPPVHMILWPPFGTQNGALYPTKQPTHKGTGELGSRICVGPYRRVFVRPKTCPSRCDGGNRKVCRCHTSGPSRNPATSAGCSGPLLAKHGPA